MSDVRGCDFCVNGCNELQRQECDRHAMVATNDRHPRSGGANTMTAISDARHSDESISRAIEYLRGRQYTAIFDGESNVVCSVNATAVSPDWLIGILTELQSLRSGNGGEVRAKPLVWDSIDSTSMWATLPKLWMCYRITLRADRLKSLRLEMLGNRNEELGLFAPWEEAQEAAQADFETRILSALEVKP